MKKQFLLLLLTINSFIVFSQKTPIVVIETSGDVTCVSENKQSIKISPGAVLSVSSVVKLKKNQSALIYCNGKFIPLKKGNYTLKALCGDTNKLSSLSIDGTFGDYVLEAVRLTLKAKAHNSGWAKLVDPKSKAGDGWGGSGEKDGWGGSGEKDGWGGSGEKDGWGGSGEKDGWGGSGEKDGWGGSGEKDGWGKTNPNDSLKSKTAKDGWGGSGEKDGWGGSGEKDGWGGSGEKDGWGGSGEKDGWGKTNPNDSLKSKTTKDGWGGSGEKDGWGGSGEKDGWGGSGEKDGWGGSGEKDGWGGSGEKDGWGGSGEKDGWGGSGEKDGWGGQGRKIHAIMPVGHIQYSKTYFSWSKPGNTMSYKLQIADKNKNILHSVIVSDTFTVIDLSLLKLKADQEYKWRVTSVENNKIKSNTQYFGLDSEKEKSQILAKLSKSKIYGTANQNTKSLIEAVALEKSEWFYDAYLIYKNLKNTSPNNLVNMMHAAFWMRGEMPMLAEAAVLP